MHAGTNDLASNKQIGTLAKLNIMTESIRNDSPETAIALSNVATRKDKAAKEKREACKI